MGEAAPYGAVSSIRAPAKVPQSRTWPLLMSPVTVATTSFSLHPLSVTAHTKSKRVVFLPLVICLPPVMSPFMLHVPANPHTLFHVITVTRPLVRRMRQAGVCHGAIGVRATKCWHAMTPIRPAANHTTPSKPASRTDRSELTSTRPTFRASLKNKRVPSPCSSSLSCCVQSSAHRAPPRDDGGADAESCMVVSTRVKNAVSSSREANRAAWPDTICSTRPVTGPCARSAPSRNCTTKAPSGSNSKLALVSGGGGVLLLWRRML